MSQARRIKPKPQQKAKKTSNLKKLPWGLMFVILCSGVVLGILFNGYLTEDSSFGSGLKAVFDASEKQDHDLEIADLIESKSVELKSTEKEFDFYEVLPDIEQVMPGDLPESIPTRPNENVSYYMQAASFREHADAEKLRARLALKGYSSVTQAREVEGKGTYYRVRLGPYPDSRKAKTAKNKLQRLGVRPFIYSVKND